MYKIVQFVALNQARSVKAIRTFLISQLKKIYFAICQYYSDTKFVKLGNNPFKVGMQMT